MFIGRGHDGRLQWVRSHSRLQKYGLPANIPTFQAIEDLTALYVATGEGRGAYIAARDAERKNHAERVVLRSSFGRNHRPSRFDGDGDSGTGHDGPPPRPPGGRPPGDGPDIIVIRPPGRSHGRPPAAAVNIEADFGYAHPPARPPNVMLPPEMDHRPAMAPIHPEHYPEYAGVAADQLHDAERLSDEDDEPEYASMPPEEDDIRISSRRDSRRTSGQRRRSHVRRAPRPRRASESYDEIVEIIEPRRARHERQRFERPEVYRGRDAHLQDRLRQQYERVEIREVHRERQRGGGPGMFIPTKTSAIGGGSLPTGEFETKSKSVV